MTDLPPIPREIWTRDVAPRFCRWGNGWAVVGSDEVVPECGEVEVWQHTVGKRAVVTTGAYVAARVVHHRAGGYTRSLQGESTRFVVAEIQERLTRGRGDDEQREPQRT